MNINDMQAAATRASDLMRALASENRLMILCQLADGEKSVGELASRLDLRHAAVSQQLALLRKDGLVAPRRDGQTIFYSIASPQAEAVIQVLYDLFCGEAAPASDGAVPALERRT